MTDDSQIVVPILPLKSSVLFPHVSMPLLIGRPSAFSAVEAALASEDKTIGVFPQNSPSTDNPQHKDLFRFGTLAVIRSVTHIQEALQVIVHGIQRIELIAAEQTSPYMTARVLRLKEIENNGTQNEALFRALIDLVKKLGELANSPMKEAFANIISEVKDPLSQVYLFASLLPIDAEAEKEFLAAESSRKLFALAYRHVNEEVQVLEIRNKIASEMATEMSRERREHLLRQQMRAIQHELGEENPEQAEIFELQERLDKIVLPEAARTEVEKELDRLKRMNPMASDYQVTRSHVEFVLDLPWNESTEDCLDLKRAREILDEDHYDLKDVKERIVEHLAVMKLNPKAKSPILCFVGPPGVGKTSVGQSIARTLGRKFERMSLGGMHDEAELRGHRRTYVGAMPGRILQAIRRSGAVNPLLMLDEIDKLGRDFHGDPSAALMEILDPVQNKEFHDNYLDIPFDLSKVFFIVTANALDTVPTPLVDRMEVLRLSGYSHQEKTEIARRYLISRQIGEAGLDVERIKITDGALSRIIKRYTREAGVRELERNFGRIARKIASSVAEGGEEDVSVTEEQLIDFLGPERFFEEPFRKQLPPGVAAGLAWTEAGGDVLYVEATLLPEGKELVLTGQLGGVMQESAKTAHSFVWSRCETLGIEKSVIKEKGLHIHVPAGATPKDGPSAGVTMAVALASLYTGRAARSDTAMTGEITLSGLLLPVGGIKEKILAAHRAGIRRVALPKRNEKDLKELPAQVKDELELILADTAEEVLAATVSGVL